MAVRDELVETTIATNANGSAARKGIELFISSSTRRSYWAGIAPDEHTTSTVALGGPEQVKEKCRDARHRWLEDLLQDTPMRFAHSGESPDSQWLRYCILSPASAPPPSCSP